MIFVLDKLAIGSYEEAIKPLTQISALLNVAVERDLDSTSLVYKKVPIVDMTPIPAEQMKEVVDGLGIKSRRTPSWCSVMQVSGVLLPQ